MNYQLLIVNDEYEIRTGLANYFPWSDIGFEVAGECGNGREALEFMDSHPIHVILCDIRMPVMDGLELAKELSGRNAGTKIVFLSGYKEFDYVRQALLYRASDYILKPTRFEQIKEVFGKLKHELDEELQPHNTLSAQEPSDIIKSIKRIVQEQLTFVTLESVAKEVYMNPFYISKLFKQKTGENFMDYVTRCRMEKAAKMLGDSLYKTYEISEMAGYSNPKNFARAFKKYYGLTPSEYRSLHLTKGEHGSDEASHPIIP